MMRPIVNQYPTVDDWKLSSSARRAGVPSGPCSVPTAWSWHKKPLVSALLVVLALSVSVVPGFDVASRVSAQSEDGILVYDYNGDGRVTCSDFIEEFPTTYTEEATAALNQFPEELSRLNADPDEDDTACDSQDEDPSGDSIPIVDEPLDLEPVPSDLPPELTIDPEPVAVADPEPVAIIEAPVDCDVIVENGRAFVYTDCADGTVQVGFQPFEGFDDFAARAQNGFGAFDDVAGATDPVTTFETLQTLPTSDLAAEAVPVPATGGTSQERAAGGPQVVEGAQKTRTPKPKQKAKERKAKLKAKKLKRAKERKAKQARLERQRESRRPAD